MDENTETVFASPVRFGSLSGMGSWGEKLRQRARELGLTDVDVARRLGLAQGRYSAYVNEIREPDLNLFVRICAALDTTPDVILGVTEPPGDTRPAVTKLLAVVSGMDDADVELAAAVVAAIATLRTKPHGADAGRTPRRRSRTQQV